MIERLKTPNKSWDRLKMDECQWSLEGFDAPPSNKFICCGLPVEGGKGIRRRFCEKHVKKGLR